MKQGNPARRQLVDTAHSLIYDLGYSFEKFSGDLVEQWGILDDWDTIPFEKPEIGSPAQEPAVQMIPMAPAEDILKSVGVNFGNAVLKTTENLKRLYGEMNTEVINNPNGITYISSKENQVIRGVLTQGLKAQFVFRHTMLGSPPRAAGCLMSALTALCMNDTGQVTIRNANCLKRAMAAYLDIPENADAFKNKIAAAHKIGEQVEGQWVDRGLTLEEYQTWLRDPVTTNGAIENPNLGDVEIELFACLMGVQVVIFVPGITTTLNEHGLTIPESQVQYFGPPTKEKIFIYSATNYTYYGLWPLLREEGYGDPETKEICNKMNDYAQNVESTMN
jgi:hypothetical protein